MRNNKGFTLIEMMVVIAIIGVLAGGIVTSIALISSGDARQASNNFVSLLSECRTNTTSGAKDVSLVISNDGRTATVWKNGNSRTEILADDNIEVEFLNVSTVVTNPTIKFDRESGAFDATSSLITSATFTGGTKTYTVTIYPYTGYFEITS